MLRIEDVLNSHEYMKVDGIYTPQQCDRAHTEVDRFWSKLASDDPVQAAAGTDNKQLFTKYPSSILDVIENKDQLILDAGCGYGRVAIPLLQGKPDVKIVGVDASVVMLRKFLSIVNESFNKKLLSRLVLLKSLINEIQLPDETFDCIYSSAVILHNPYHDVPKIIEEFRRLLKPNGMFIAVGSFPNVYNFEGIQNFMYLNLIVDEHQNGPVRIYTRKRVKHLFNNWANVKVLPVEITFIPRQIMKIKMPFGRTIRAMNKWIDKKDIPWIKRTTLLVRWLDVITTK